MSETKTKRFNISETFAIFHLQFASPIYFVEQIYFANCQNCNRKISELEIPAWNQWAIKWHFGKLAKVRLNESESHTGNDQLSPLAVKVFASMEPFDLFTFWSCEYSKYFLCLRYNALRSMIVLLCFLKSEF